MAVGVVTLMGLLPHGIEISGKTANELAVTRIVQQAVGEIQVSNWAQLDTAAGMPVRKFYDDQGIEIQQGSADFAYRLSYVAEVTVSPTAGAGGGGVLQPARLSSNSNSPAAVEQVNLRRVQINIVERPQEDFDFTSAPLSSYRSITQLVAKMR